jgi:acyl dehydratase
VVQIRSRESSVEVTPQPFHLDAEAAKEMLFDGLREVDPSPLPR